MTFKQGKRLCKSKLSGSYFIEHLYDVVSGAIIMLFVYFLIINISLKSLLDVLSGSSSFHL